MLLNLHSYFSLRYGTINIDDLTDLIISHGHDTAVLTDINNSSAIFPFIKKCREKGINARRTFQSIATSSDDSSMEEFSAWRFNNMPESGKSNQIANLPDAHTFFQLISSYDCEDLVGIYLQRHYGYCLIPSSCKIDTAAYEYLLKDPETGKSVGVQVKQGKNSLDNSLSKSAGKIFLFTTQGSVSSVDKNVTVIQPEDLFLFVIRNANLIPDSIKTWLFFKQESILGK